MPGGRRNRLTGSKSSTSTENVSSLVRKQDSTDSGLGNDVARKKSSGSSLSSGSERSNNSPGQVCCTPLGCYHGSSAEPMWNDSSFETVRVTCSNGDCTAGKFMHKKCFQAWERSLLVCFEEQPYTRTWTEHQKLQQLWSDRGYDAVRQACACLCLQGALRKDCCNQNSSATGLVRPLPNRKVSAPVSHMPNGPASLLQPLTVNTVSVQANGQHPPDHLSSPLCAQYDKESMDFRYRARTLSLSNKHPPVSVSSNQRNSGGSAKSLTSFSNRFDVESLQQIATSGSIFKRRDSFTPFYERLPSWKVNHFNVKMEDDCPQGNDDMRQFLLTTLGNAGRTSLHCMLCVSDLAVYDRYPLIDGTLFLSPRNYDNGGVQMKYENETRFLLAICVSCLVRSAEIACEKCEQKNWFHGMALVLGTCYTYDVLAAFRCVCVPLCNRCSAPLPAEPRHVASFSTYSQPCSCDACGFTDRHYLNTVNAVRPPVF